MFNLAQKGLVLVLIPVAFELVFVWQVGRLLREVDEQIRQEQIAADVLVASENYFADMLRGNAAAISYRAYKDPKYVALHEETIQALGRDFKEMRRVAEGNPEALAALNMVARREVMAIRIRRMMIKSDEEARVSTIFGGPMFTRLFASTDLTRDPIMDAVNGQSENTERDSELRIQAIRRTLLWWLVGGGVFSIVLTVLLALFFQKQIYAKLKHALTNIHRMTRREPMMPPLSGRDEISELDRAIVRTGSEITRLEKFRTESAELMAAELHGPLEDITESLSDTEEFGFEELSETGAQRIDGAKALVSRLQVLVGDLQSMETITQARMQFCFTEGRLHDIIAAAVAATASIAEPRRIAIRVHSDESIMLTSDESRLTQVVINLLSNALKFSPDDSEVIVSARLDGEFARVSVTDRGKGISTEFRSRVFHRFEQAAESDQAKGSGLGLSICREIVEAHGGTMDFESAPGNTEFWFRVPLKPAKPQVEGDTARQSKSGAVRRPLWRVALPLLLVPLVVQLSVIAALYCMVERAHEQIEQFRRARQIASTCSDLSRRLMLASVNAMLYNSGDKQDSFRNGFRTQAEIIEADLAKIQKLSENDSRNKMEASRVADAVRKGLESTKTLMNSSESDMRLKDWVSKSPELLSVADPSTGLGAGFSDWIHSNQNAQSNQLAMSEQSRRQIMLVLWCGIAASLAATMVLAIAFVRGICRRVSRILDNTRRLINGEPLVEPDATRSDELGDVDREFYLAGQHLRELDQFKDELFSVTSHELRTPLTGLLGSFDVMALGVYGKLTQRGEDLIARARQASLDLISLITNFLDLEKMRSGKKLVMPEPIKASDLRTELDRLAVSNESLNKDFTVNVDVPRLMQALSAVVSQGSHLSIDENAGTAQVTVRCSQTRSESPLRRDLNLSLCANVAQQHGGKFEVNGENLVFRLPSSQS